MSMRSKPKTIETPSVPTEVSMQLTMDDLTPEEQAAASLGVEPDSLVCLKWMNDKHHETLLKQNALSETLARRIEAYRHISEREG